LFYITDLVRQSENGRSTLVRLLEKEAQPIGLHGFHMGRIFILCGQKFPGNLAQIVVDLEIRSLQLQMRIESEEITFFFESESNSIAKKSRGKEVFKSCTNNWH
jgi:hypothetical protein